MKIESYFIGQVLQKRAQCSPDEKVIITPQGAMIVPKTKIDKLVERMIGK